MWWVNLNLRKLLQITMHWQNFLYWSLLISSCFSWQCKTMLFTNKKACSDVIGACTSQQAHNVVSMLKYGWILVTTSTYFNDDTTSKLQCWIMVAILTLHLRWNTVDTLTLTMVEKWLSVWCFNDFEIMILSCLFPSPHSFYWLIINA